MPLLAGGYHLPFAQKLAISNAAFLAMAWELTDEEEGFVDNLEDTGAILTFAGTLYILWIPPVVQASIAARVGVLLAPAAVPAAIVTSTIIAGGIISYFVDPDEGIQNYRSFLSEPKKIPGRTAWALEMISKDVVEPAIGRAEAFGRFLWGYAERQLQRTGFSQNHPFVI